MSNAQVVDANKSKDSVNVAAVVVTFNRLEKLKPYWLR